MGAPSSMQLPVRRPLVFALNGERVVLPNVDPATTLLHYIRSETRFKGPKRSCGEGGCGACLVMLAKYNPETKEVKESSVNACLVLLCSVDGCAITTTEGLGNQRNGFHAIQKRLSAFHGSQCGFCTPGMTMAIYSCLKHDQQHQTKATAAQTNGNVELASGAASSGPTCETLERAIQGNICRCTGYRPILDVCKSFASDVDLEDLGLNTCWTDKADAKQENLPAYDPSADPTFPEFLIDELESRKISIHGNRTAHNVIPGKEAGAKLDARFKNVESSKGGDEERAWVSASNLTELSAALNVLKGKREQVKLVVGNTSSGYHKHVKPQVFVDISQIPELLAVRRDAQSLEIGAATRIAELIDYLEDFEANPVAAGLAHHLKKLAGGHVRNWGSVGGNLVMAQQFAFESDIATILLGAGASVEVVTLKASDSYATHKLSLEEFLANGKILGEDSVLQSVHIPLAFDTKTVFRTYRGAPRPCGNAISLANAAFLARVTRNEEDSTVIESTRLAFGTFGTKHAIRALKVEKLLNGKSLTLSLIKECVELLKEDVVPLDGTDKKEYRVALVVGFLFEFLNDLLTSDQTVTPAPLFPHVGKQSITVSDEMYPLSQPTAKILSQLQASGEAVYVDDIPSPPHCLHAAFVLSSQPHAKLEGSDAKVALGSAGAVAFISVKDIPEGGKNVGLVNTTLGMETEILFAEDTVGYVGQPLGVMVADTYDHAKLAAQRVHVKYDTHSVETPILTIDEAIARNSIYPVPEFLKAGHHHRIGDAGKALAEAEFQLEGEVSTASQNHFYMETQVTLAVPDEDGCMTIYTATQSPDFVQQAVAFCLNIPLNKVRIICRRLGGGFGGKVSRNQHVTVAVALAAYKLQRPVRISLDRNTDMQMIGGRLLTKTKFTVGFTKTGKITALKVNVLMESGWFIDFHLIMLGSMDAVLKKYNYGTLDLNFTLCKTNNVPKSAVRAPGDAQCSAIAESIVDHVASYLDISGIKVRDENMHTVESLNLFHGEDMVGDKEGFTLPSIWSRLKSRARVEDREMEVERFNKQSKWLKRGLGMVPCVYHVLGGGNTSTVSIFQDGSIVVEVGGVEMGQGLYTKVGQAVAYTLSPLCSKKEEVTELLTRIRILQFDTLHLPNSFVDGFSTTSEATCAAAQEACAVLVQRLLPVKEELAKAHPNGEVLWENLCFTAKFRQLDLQSHQRWMSPLYQYLLYGAGVSEVEVNILTGETRILATDLIYDAGKSLNSAVDIGQVEGAFVFGLGFYLTEEVLRDSKGKVVSDGTWTYKPPTFDIIPRSFNVELYKSPLHKDRIFSSKAVGEPPLLLAGSVYTAIRSAIKTAREEYNGDNGGCDVFEFNTPATMDKVKKLCGIDNVEKYLQLALKV